MYLVHIHLQPPSDGISLPPGTPELVTVAAPEEAGLELAVLHADVEPHPVLGLYVRAPSLEAAEGRACEIWQRSFQAHPVLRRWSLIKAEVPLLLPDSAW
ncbi:hypothetical protein [Streptomyces sp. NPDC096339]|uniref:hypothetical protein n=1 Tax=Streptomyces sp. NPDC096339 TaxID=3366086 RepID=UPI0038094A12